MAGKYDIEAVRKEWIGKETPTLHGKYPVEYEAIRRHCQMVGDENPLFLDEEYAKGTKYNGVICPPVAVPMFSIPGRLMPVDPERPSFPIIDLGVPLPGDAGINMSQEMEFFKPVKVGDRLSSKDRIADMFQKATGLDPETVWIISEQEVTNQKGELVCIVRNTLINYRTNTEQGG